jgi:hypothetical protein
MQSSEITSEFRSNFGRGKSDGKSVAEAGKSAVDDWLPRICRTIAETKIGTALHFLTGYPERDCQRYAAGHVEPRASFLRAALRTNQGLLFLTAIMEGCDEPWWAEIQRARRIVAAIDREA